MKLGAASLVLVVIIAGGMVWYARNKDVAVLSSSAPELVTPIAVVPSPTASPVIKPVPTPTATPFALPVKISLSVPFTSQAPTANWDAVHEETCEEAALLMAIWYTQGKSGVATADYENRVTPAEAESALQSAIAWEKATFGYFEDTTIAEGKRLLEEYGKVKNVRMVKNVTAAMLKKELAQGNVIVAPTAGQLLGNPNFKAPGPPYHMILIRGYEGDTFITNDPGTRKGENYRYSGATLINAIHDWTGDKATITRGANVVLVVGA